MFYFQALRVGEKKKRQSWQPFPRFVHLKAALRGVTAKQRLAQLSVLSRGLLSTLKVSLWNSESWVLPFRSFHTDAKFQDWLWCLSKVARHPAVIIPGNCLALWSRDKIIAAPREEASCTETMTTTSFSHFKGLADYADGHQRVRGRELTCTHFEITGNITQQPCLKAVGLEPSKVQFSPLFVTAAGHKRCYMPNPASLKLKKMPA